MSIFDIFASLGRGVGLPKKTIYQFQIISKIFVCFKWQREITTEVKNGFFINSIVKTFNIACFKYISFAWMGNWVT